MEKHDAISHDFQGTVVNRAMLYLHGGLLKITRTLPLTKIETPKKILIQNKIFPFDFTMTE